MSQIDSLLPKLHELAQELARATSLAATAGSPKVRDNATALAMVVDKVVALEGHNLSIVASGLKHPDTL